MREPPYISNKDVAPSHDRHGGGRVIFNRHFGRAKLPAPVPLAPRLASRDDEFPNATYRLDQGGNRSLYECARASSQDTIAIVALEPGITKHGAHTVLGVPDFDIGRAAKA